MEEEDEVLDPATPELFAGAYSYSSDGRATPDDTSSLDGVTSANAHRVKRKRRGRPPLYLTGDPLESWSDPDTRVDFKVGDFIFFDGRKAGDSFRVGTVLAIRSAKKRRTLASIRLYFKAAQLPEGVYQRLMDDRNSENLGGFGDFLVANPHIREREVFKSEKTEVIRCHSVRGRCTVIQFADVKAVRKFEPETDTYFTLLGYNPDTRRLATIQGEIRIGSSHQAKLPGCNPSVSPGARPCRSMPEGIGGGNNGEERLWSPERIQSDELDAYITATVSMVASFTNMSERKSVDEGVATAKRDENTQLALNHLHRSDYDKGDAIAEFVKSVPLVRSIDRRWEEDDSKKFMKGLRVFGKNFFRIRKEFLPEKETKELIEYYYYWKKTPISTIQNRTGRRSKVRKAGGSASKAPSSAGENSSESEEMESNESYTCFRCDTESSNQWHYVDQHGFVCESCKLNYRKYGDEQGDRIPEYLFRPVEPVSHYRRPLPKRKPKDEEETGMDTEDLLPSTPVDQERKSPSASSTSSDTCRTPRKRKSPGKAKRSIMNTAEPETPTKPAADENAAAERELAATPVEHPENEPMATDDVEKKKKMEESSPDSLASELNRDAASRDGDVEDTGNMGDVEQDDNSTTNSEDSLTAEDIVTADDSTPEPCHELFHKREYAHFVRCLKRVNNSCCRVDVHYVPPPGSTMAKRREEQLKKPLAVAQPSVAPPPAHSQNTEPKVKTEPFSHSSSGGNDVIRHTSQSQHPMRATVPPSTVGMLSPHHLNRDQHRMTPIQAQAAAMASAAHHSRVTTPSQRVTPRSQQSAAAAAAAEHMQMMGSNTPALLQLSQLAGRQQSLCQQQSLADEMARLAAYSAATSAPTASAMGLAPGMDNPAMFLQCYRMLRGSLPQDHIDRMYTPEMRERLDMALKAQEMDSHQKMMMAAQAGASGAVDSKALIEAQMMEMQRKFGLPPGAMMHPGAMAGMPMGLHPSNVMSSANASELMAREREKMSKFGLFPGSMLADPMAAMASSPAERMSAERLSAERLTAVERLSAEQQRLAAGISAANTAHAHTHTHTHLHLHQQAEQQAAAAAAAAQAAQAAQAAAMATQNPYLAQQLLQSMGSMAGSSSEHAALARAAAAGGLSYGPLPPGFPGSHPMMLNIPTSSASGADMPQMMAALAAAQQGGQENPRDLLLLQQMLANPAAMAQHEALQRHMMLQQQQERERQLSHHMPPH